MLKIETSTEKPVMQRQCSHMALAHVMETLLP